MLTDSEPLKTPEAEIDIIDAIKKSLDLREEAALLCQPKSNNPNYLSIIHANPQFCELFDLEIKDIYGKNYDFLFNDLDLDYASDDQLEYVRLVKSVKSLKQCSIIIRISIPHKRRFKVSFTPGNYIDGEETTSQKTEPYGIFVFEEVTVAESSNDEILALSVKNMERTLNNEKLLRQIGYLIISDLTLIDISQSIAKTLCEHLKADRCLMHDYVNGQTNFVVEYKASDAKAIIQNSDDPETINLLTRYINFQNHFYERTAPDNKATAVLILDDLLTNPSFSVISDICNQYRINSEIAVTTALNNEINGGIYIHQSNKRSWLVEEIKLVEMIADQFSIAIERSRSIERVMVANHQLLEKTIELKHALKEEKNLRKMQSEFVALISHEFKTPLQIIDSTREVVARKLKSLNDPALDKSLDKIKTGVKRMNDLITSVLNLSKLEVGQSAIKIEKKDFDFKALIAEVIERNISLAQNKNITIETKLDSAPTNFNGDPKLLDHCFTNIITNAFKYSKDNTVVKIIDESNEQQAVIKVIDQGIGIPKDDLLNIGKKFYRAKNTLAVAGTGIGLFLTKQFIDLHHGTFQVASEPNIGTTITVILPKNLTKISI